jgi:hypothetical protein
MWSHSATRSQVTESLAGFCERFVRILPHTTLTKEIQMIRKAFFALMAVLMVAASTQAGVVVSSDEGVVTPGLTGFKTFTLTATSDVAGEFISVIDFIGDKDNTNPATARGFFGAMNQLEAGGPGTTVFNNANFFFPNNGIADSQFKENSGNVIVAASSESTTSLRAGYAYATPSALSLQFAQLTLPDAGAGRVDYRGVFSVARGGTIVDLPELTGCVGVCGQVGVPPLVADVSGQTNALGDVIMLMPMDSAPGTAPVTFSALAGPTYTKGFGAPDHAFGLGAATWSWDPALQKFQFNTLGSTRGTYVWTGTADGPGGSDPFSITVDVRHVPEPATLSLLGLALVGFVGVARKRS